MRLLFVYLSYNNKKSSAYHAYTSCIFLTPYFADIDFPPFVWTRTNDSRLVRSTPPVQATMSDNLNMEAFKKQLKEEIAADTRNIIREVMGEMLQTARQKQPIDLEEDDVVIGKTKDQERDDDLETILTDPPKQEFQPVADPEKSKWAKEMAKVKSQMQLLMKDKGIDVIMDYGDLDLDHKEPLPKKFKFPEMKKYSGTEDPHLHLKQYVTHIRTTELTKA